MHKTGFFLCRLMAGLLLFSFLFLGTSAFMRGSLALPSVSAETLPTAVVVLDAGHGGEDGGAVGVDGSLEKDLNLSLTLMLGELLTAEGIAVVYTRTDDRLLYTEEQNIKGKRKMYDLANRLAIAEATEGAILVSIHMNKFSDAKQKGLQVYYGKNSPDSRLLAEGIRTRAKTDLDPTNRRKTKAADSSIYLLSRATCPAVLVECGFLSNPEECQKLSSEDYKRELSFSLFCAIMEYIRNQNREENRL